MDNQNKNLLLATLLSVVVIVVWGFLFPPPEPIPQPTTATTETQPPQTDDVSQQSDATATIPPPPSSSTFNTPSTQNSAPAINESARLIINTPRVRGSILLNGGLLDDLSLKDYKQTLDAESDIVHVLAPRNSKQPYYVLYGWLPLGDLGRENAPSINTPWRIETGTELTPSSPVTLRWDSPNGIIYRRVISIDDNYVLTIEQSITNPTNRAIRLQPYAIIARHGTPPTTNNFFILHEGVIRASDDHLQEIDYDDMAEWRIDPREQGGVDRVSVKNNGWIGFTDKYWMAALLPPAGQTFDSVAKYVPAADIYQVETRMPAIDIAANSNRTNTGKVFVGAKEWNVIKTYETQDNVKRFVDAIDWGWFFFLTKPIFIVLFWLKQLIGNMGLAIIALTFLIKALLFPLAYKSYVAIARMKELQPQMQSIKERVGDDRTRLQQEMMALYKKEKVNPASGCLPIILQIPIFFSLYKVIFVTIELRHAPFYGWLRDLSAPDPTSFLNLFGLLPYATPNPASILGFVSIGVLPILMGISMWLQQKLNPAPTDPTQAMVFSMLPWVFMFMLGQFASGLILYWIANNILTFAQQYIIMLRHGHKPDLWSNVLRSFKRNKETNNANNSK